MKTDEKILMLHQKFLDNKGYCAIKRISARHYRGVL